MKEWVVGPLISGALTIVLAPLLTGIIKKIKALSQKRKGVPVYQLYLDLFKLISKDSVISNQSTFVLRLAPYVVLLSAVIAALFIPVSVRLWTPAFAGDVIVVLSILALGRFFLVLAGLDTASTFTGMGSSREIMISVLFEPALLLSAFTLSVIAGTSSLTGIAAYIATLGTGIVQPVFILLFISVFMVLIAETSRIPVDDPATHLELTMIHEGMILEHSGKYLAFMELGACVKQLVLLNFLSLVFLPTAELEMLFGAEFALPFSILLYIVKVVLLSVLLAFVEIFTVKLRLLRNSELAVFSFIAAFIGFIQYFVLGGAL